MATSGRAGRVGKSEKSDKEKSRNMPTKRIQEQNFFMFHFKQRSPSIASVYPLFPISSHSSSSSSSSKKSLSAESYQLLLSLSVDLLFVKWCIDSTYKFSSSSISAGAAIMKSFSLFGIWKPGGISFLDASTWAICTRRIYQWSAARGINTGIHGWHRLLTSDYAIE